MSTEAPAGGPGGGGPWGARLRRPAPWALGLLAAALAVLAAGHVFLASPALPLERQQELCAQRVEVADGLSYPFNCDSPNFLDVADDPGALLDDGEARQARPGLPAAAAVLTPLLRPVRALVPDAYGLDRPAHIAYLLLNILIVAAALLLAVRLVGPGPAGGAALAAVLPLMLFNDVVKAFFWSPHTTLFVLLAPLAAVATTTAVLRGRIGRPLPAALLGAGLGLASLVYGLFVVGVAAAGLALLLLWRPRRAIGGRRLLAAATALGASAALPQLAWMATARAATGRYYNHEVEMYDQFVWAPQALAEGPGTFARELGGNLADFAAATWPVLIVPLLVALLLGAATAAGGTAGVRAAVRRATGDPVVQGALLVLAAEVAFLAMMGFYAERLSWALVPPLLIIGGRLPRAADPAAPRSAALRAGATAAAVAVALAAAAHTVASPGPWA